MPADFWDRDIAELTLTDAEKNGLQVFRNYSRAFEDHAEKQFAQEVNAEEFGTDDLRRVFSLIIVEDPRFLPVVACAFADDLLQAMFRRAIPDSVPGGRSSLLGPYGPFADLFKRIQLAHIFEMLSPDLAVDLDRLRKARNEIAHSWDIAKLSDFYSRRDVSDVFPVDALLHERPDWFPNLSGALEPVKAFRIKVIWIIARLSYEAPLYARSRDKRLVPQRALYGPNHPMRLVLVSQLAMEACRGVLRGEMNEPESK